MSRNELRSILANAALNRQRLKDAVSPNQLDIPPSKTLYQDHDHGVFDRNNMRRSIQEALEKHGVGCLKTLHGIAKKILDNLDDDKSKYRELRRNLDAVRRKIYEPEGVLQIVIDMGFRETRAADLDEYRVWLPKYTDRLRLYAELLSDAIMDAPLQLASRDESIKIERKREEDEDSVKKVRQRFKSDREAVRDRSEREKIQQQAHATAMSRAASSQNDTAAPQQTRRTKSVSNIHTLDELERKFSEATLNARN
ncbi:hypothetical protein Moror_16031 [Moniliophthora roreri MCA 2997]|uniref:PUB domain-containing protein n=2 Tax=Moniliophthora roreri TaxID=221103 RepID=V2XJK7_MONRO|nr:hypothetical protein Moror_16031 [Moniliophthora roreri MCA 2997]KAI3613012.1 hypothetical protein WG66_005376 [Moniliophthora roreri]